MQQRRWLGLAVLFVFLDALPAMASIVPQRTVLDNGIVVLTSQQPALPMISIELLIDAGSRFDPEHKAGLANLTAKLLTYGTERRSATEISETLDFIGASLTTGSGKDVASISLTLLKKDLATGLELLRGLTATKPEIPAVLRGSGVHAGSIAVKHVLPGERRFCDGHRRQTSSERQLSDGASQRDPDGRRCAQAGARGQGE